MPTLPPMALDRLCGGDSRIWMATRSTSLGEGFAPFAPTKVTGACDRHDDHRNQHTPPPHPPFSLVDQRVERDRQTPSVGHHSAIITSTRALRQAEAPLGSLVKLLLLFARCGSRSSGEARRHGS